MTNKTKIIIVSIILVVFIIIFGIIIYIHFSNKDIDIDETFEHNYAVNDTYDPNEDVDLSEFEELDETDPYRNDIVMINDVPVNHVERLTDNQSKKRQSMVSKLYERTNVDEETHGTPNSIEVLDSSTKFQVYLQVTFEDNEQIIYVCSYDDTNLHQFLRCVSLDEWNEIQRGDNAG